MTKISKYFILLFLVLTGLAFTACSSDDEDAKDDVEVGPSADVKYEIIDKKELSAEQMCNELFSSENSGDKESAELRDQFLANIHHQEDSLAEVYGANSASITMGFVSYTYKYWSTDQHGKQVELSARVSWAQYWLLGWRDLDPNNIYLVEHYTIFSNDECPSNSYVKEQIALGDNLLIMPDYLGYGETRTSLHPYLNHEVCAINSLDALKAGYAVFENKKGSNTKLEDDWKLYVIGASQGGANALAVHKWLDTHAEFADKWRFAYSFCCAGPYSPSLTMKKYYEAKTLAYPMVLPLTIKSMLDSYPEILGKWKEEDFYSEKYLKIKTDMDKLLAGKIYESEELIAKMKTLLGCDPVTTEDVLSKEVLDMNSEMAKAFFKCLEKNDLTKGWTPTHLIKLYHSKADEVVPYANAEAVINAFDDKVKMREASGGHKATCMKWYGILLIKDW